MSRLSIPHNVDGMRPIWTYMVFIWLFIHRFYIHHAHRWHNIANWQCTNDINSLAWRVPSNINQCWLTPPNTLHFVEHIHYNDVTMDAIASQITSLTIVSSTIYSDADQRKHQSSASLAFVLGIHRWPVNSPHKWPVTRKTFPFDDMYHGLSTGSLCFMSRCTGRCRS